MQTVESDRADRLLALGVTVGAPIRVLQTFPGVVFLCDQTELAVERGVAYAILVKVDVVSGVSSVVSGFSRTKE